MNSGQLNIVMCDFHLNSFRIKAGGIFRRSGASFVLSFEVRFNFLLNYEALKQISEISSSVEPLYYINNARSRPASKS